MLPLKPERFTSVPSYRMDKAVRRIRSQGQWLSDCADVMPVILSGQADRCLGTCIALADSGAAHEALRPHH